MGQRLNATITEVSFLELSEALSKAWKDVTEKSPSNSSLAVLLAQSALETGHWQSCRAFNLGNAKAGPSWHGDFCFYAADEIVSTAQAARAYADRNPRTDGIQGHDVELRPLADGRVQVTLHPDHAWCRFRAFSSLEEGARDYLGLLHRRFTGAWPALETGDAEAFVRALKQLNYFTASVERYLPPVLKLFERFSLALESAQAPHTLPPAPLLPTPDRKRPTLRAGARGDSVVELQRILLSLGYTDFSITGVLDEATNQAVELFQLQHIDSSGRPLASDGVVGPKTWWALDNPSGDAQESFMPTPPVGGLTPTRRKLLEILDREHQKPVSESPDGSNRSKDIDRYFGNTGLRGQPWCCAFVSWALERALGEFPIGGIHHPGVQRMWVMANDLGMAVDQPKPGDLFIQIKSKGTGHTGFVIGVSEDGRSVYTCEGNAGNRLKYGQRQVSTIHHFVDCIADEQDEHFERGANVTVESVEGESTV
jgi:hypothetical protein